MYGTCRYKRFQDSPPQKNKTGEKILSKISDRFVLTNRHQLYKQKTRWWFQIFFIFTTIWERWTQFCEHIFQMGLKLNHQPEEIWKQATNTPHHKTVTHRRLVELKDLPSCHWVHSCGYSFCKNRQLERCCLESPSGGVVQDVRASCHRWILRENPWKLKEDVWSILVYQPCFLVMFEGVILSKLWLLAIHQAGQSDQISN